MSTDGPGRSNYLWLESIQVGLGDVCDASFDAARCSAEGIASKLARAARTAAHDAPDPESRERAARADRKMQGQADALCDNLVAVVDWNVVSVMFALIRAEAAALMEHDRVEVDFPAGEPPASAFRDAVDCPSAGSAVPINTWLDAAFRRTTDGTATAIAAALACGLGDSSPSDRCTKAFVQMGVITVGDAVRIFSNGKTTRLRRQHLLGQLNGALARSGCPAAEIRVVIAEVRALPSLAEIAEHEDKVWSEFCAGYRKAQRSWREVLHRFAATRSEALAAKVAVVDATTDPTTGQRTIDVCLPRNEWSLGVQFSSEQFQRGKPAADQDEGAEWLDGITEVVPASVGDKHGLLVGDVILQIGGTRTVGLGLPKVKELLRTHTQKHDAVGPDDQVGASRFTLVVIQADRFLSGDDMPLTQRGDDIDGGLVSHSANGSRIAGGAEANDGAPGSNADHTRFEWNGVTFAQVGDDIAADPAAPPAPASDCPRPAGDNPAPKDGGDAPDWHAVATQALASDQRHAEAALDDFGDALDRCDLVAATRTASVAQTALASFFKHHKFYEMEWAQIPSIGISEIESQIVRRSSFCRRAQLVAAHRAAQQEPDRPGQRVPAGSANSSTPSRVNPVLQLLLAGTADPDCPLSTLRGHQDVLEMLWLAVIQIYADQLDTATPAYSILPDAKLKFPASQGLQVNMMPFELTDVNSLPPECRQWWPIISTCTSCLSADDVAPDENGEAVGYLTIDERDTGGGASHRRGGLHTESPGARFVMGSGDPVKVAPYYHGWGIGMRMGERRFGGGIFMASNVSDSTAVYGASVVRPQDTDDPEAAAGMIGALGDCEHLRPAVAHTRRTLGANELLWMTDMTLHESLPIDTPVHRQYFRLVTREIGAWYEHHSTPNPLKVTPPPCVRIIKASKFGADGHDEYDEAKAAAARTVTWENAGLTSAVIPMPAIPPADVTQTETQITSRKMSSKETEGISDAINALTIASSELTDNFSKNLDEFNSREAARTEQHEASVAALEDELAAQRVELNAKEEEHIEERRTLDDEIAALDGTHQFTKSKVKLDIGGRRFTTSRATLKTSPHSFFAAMLSGRYDVIPDPQDGSYFIDRDGQHFHHILNYMRGPDNFECPTDKAALEVLNEDAVYYQLVDFGGVVEAALAKASNSSMGRRPQAGQRDRNGQYMSTTEATWADADAARTRDPHSPSAGPWNGAAR